MLSILCVALTIKVKVGIPESFEVGWYRQKITGLSHLKILERVMYNRLLRFLNNHNILSYNQYGFRKHHSTAYALTCLYDTDTSAIENKECTVGIFIDLSKAFDTVDHNILI